MRFFIVLLCALLVVGKGQAQSSQPSPTNDFQAAVASVQNQGANAIAQACRGAVDPSLSVNTGLPNDRVDDMRCMAISELEPACLNLAVSAGTDAQAVLLGETTYDALTNQALNETGGAAAQASESLYLARQFGGGEVPAQLVLEVFKSCTSQILAR